ncbi:MAG TPA: glycine cleavage system aminomethyltransferase GcvT [bacterium]|nr:glycine cleavage system aminomethyltransferase GcvT [bacterium]
MLQTRLHDWHRAHGARMVDFGGWDMPVQYETGPREEHQRVRQAAGLFDIDHMGRVEVTGADALAFLQHVQTWDVSRMAPGRAHYSLLLNESGGVVDDIFIYRREGSWLLIINAANAPKDVAWLSSHARGFSVHLRDLRDETCLVALQGPAACEVLQGLAPGSDLAGMGFHRVAEHDVARARVTLCTTGYTGEPGFELLMPAAEGVRLWEAILAAGAARRLLPCGLAARDSLRAEVCFPLYGNEMDESTDPLSAGLMHAAVRLEGHDFIGRRALAALALKPLERILVGFEMTEPGVPRHGYRIRKDGAEIGAVTTGLFSPSTGKYVGMGYVKAEHSAVGTALEIVIRDSTKGARVVQRPFYSSPNWR